MTAPLSITDAADGALYQADATGALVPVTRAGGDPLEAGDFLARDAEGRWVGVPFNQLSGDPPATDQVLTRDSGGTWVARTPSHVFADLVRVTGLGSGIVLASPGGDEFVVRVSDAGALEVTPYTP